MRGAALSIVLSAALGCGPGSFGADLRPHGDPTAPGSDATDPRPDVGQDPSGAVVPETNDDPEPTPATSLIVSDPVRQTLVGGWGTVPVTVPPDAHSFIAVVQGRPQSLLGPVEVVDPAGRTVMSLDQSIPTLSSALHYNYGLGTVLLPLSRTVLPTAGVYELVVSSDSDADLDVSVRTIAKVGHDPEALRANGRLLSLDVVHHLVSVPGLSAATAERDADFAAATGELGRILHLAGIEVHAVDYVQLDEPALSSVDSLDGANSEFATLLSRASDGRVLHLFWVEQMSDGSSADFVTLGMAGGIGAPASLGGTPESGVVIATLDLRFDPIQVGMTAAHEVLHFLGLFHSTEQCAVMNDSCGLASSDPLSDTPDCPASRDVNRDGFLDAQECGSYDGYNIMFWLADPGQSDLTPEQAQIVRANPLTY